MSATAAAPKAAVEVDPDARARLAALGYVGTFVTALAPDRAGLADPKDKIQLFNLMTQAREIARHDKESDEGLHALERVVARGSEGDRRVVHARQRVLPPPAVRPRHRQFKRALALKPDYDLVVINMANAYRALGRDQEAMVGYRRFMELDPKNAQIRYEAAQILIDGGKLDEARAAADAGARSWSRSWRPRATRSACWRCAAATWPAPRREIRAAIAEKADVRLAHFNLALLAEQQGDLHARDRRIPAERSSSTPTATRRAFNLGRLYERIGDRHAQVDGATSRQSTINPSFAEGHLFLAKLVSRP